MGLSAYDAFPDSHELRDVLSDKLEKRKPLSATDKFTLLQILKDDEELIVRDQTTGVFNRRSMHRYITEAIEQSRAEDYDGTTMLMHIDLDDFRKYNARHGRADGDHVLKLVAEHLSDRVKPRDRIGRPADDEFLILAYNMPPESAQAHLDSLVADLPKRAAALNRRDVTMSLGAAYLEQGMEMAELLLHAEQALYLAKITSNKAHIWEEGVSYPDIQHIYAQRVG